jgi:SAM-dependent methyltransferase
VTRPVGEACLLLLGLAVLLGAGGCRHHRVGDPAAYLEMLERPERAEWQRPDDVVDALGLRGDEVIYDVGAGSGYFTFRLALAVPEGDFVAYIKQRAFDLAVVNVTAVLTDADDPGVGAEADLVFVCDVLHHVEEWEDWVARLYEQMSPGARLAIIEFRQGDLPVGPDDSMKLPRAEVAARLAEVGFRGPREIDGVLPYQWFLIFER